MKRYTLSICLFITIAVSFLTVLPLFHAGWFPMHDDAQVQRVYEMQKSLQDGLFPVRWVNDLGYGYGYPIFTFYAPIAYYLGAFFSFVVQNVLIGTKLMIGFGMLLSGVSMFLLGRRLWGDIGGALSAIFYVFAPYHSLDIYVRGDMAESIAYACIPLIFIGLYECYKNNTLKGIAIGSIGYALVLCSHNLTALMVTPFVIATGIFLSFLSKDRTRILSYTALLIIGLLLSAWYWVPVFSEMHYTNVLSQIGGGADFRDHFVCFGQLWNSPWGYGGSTRGCMDGLSFRIGKLHVIFAGIAFLMSLFWYRSGKLRGKVLIGLLLFTLIAVYLLLPLSKPVWEAIRPMAFFQYPWRFLLMISFFTSLMVGSLATYIPKKRQVMQYGLLILLIGATLVLYQKLFTPQSYIPQTVSSFETRENLDFNTSQISHEYMPSDFEIPRTVEELPNTKIVLRSGGGTISSLKSRTGYLKADVTVPTSTTASFSTAYFPAWHLKSDGIEIPLHKTRTGMTAVIPKGNHTVQLFFKQTFIEVFANAISLICAILMLCAIIKVRYGRH